MNPLIYTLLHINEMAQLWCYNHKICLMSTAISSFMGLFNFNLRNRPKKSLSLCCYASTDICAFLNMGVAEILCFITGEREAVFGNEGSAGQEQSHWGGHIQWKPDAAEWTGLHTVGLVKAFWLILLLVEDVIRISRWTGTRIWPFWSRLDHYIVHTDSVPTQPADVHTNTQLLITPLYWTISLHILEPWINKYVWLHSVLLFCS